jgi:hypothetical protein
MKRMFGEANPSLRWSAAVALDRALRGVADNVAGGKKLRGAAVDLA